jgi:hypothetical protein
MSSLQAEPLVENREYLFKANQYGVYPSKIKEAYLLKIKEYQKYLIDYYNTCPCCK